MIPRICETLPHDPRQDLMTIGKDGIRGGGHFLGGAITLDELQERLAIEMAHAPVDSRDVLAWIQAVITDTPTGRQRCRL